VRPVPIPSLQVVEIDMCIPESYFILSGEKTMVPYEPFSTSLTRAAKAARAHGAQSVAVRSWCKLTDGMVCEVCEVFQANGIRVIGVKVPQARPPGSRIRTCDEEECLNTK
jgi:hypothetical protein